MNVYFLGGGNMAAAVAGGLVKQGGYRIHIANRGAESANVCKKSWRSKLLKPCRSFIPTMF